MCYNGCQLPRHAFYTLRVKFITYQVQFFLKHSIQNLLSNS